MTTPSGTTGDNPRVIDVLIAIPLLRDEADLWEDVARHMGLTPRGVSPIDAFHLCALRGLQIQMRKNGMDEQAEIVGDTLERLAREMGVWPHQRGETATAAEAEGRGDDHR